MKHFLYSAFFLICFTAHAQFDSNEQETLSTGISGIRAAGDTNKQWMNYGRIVYDLAGPRSYFRNYLYPDTNVLVSFSSGMGNVWKHSYGQVIDPSSKWFASKGVKINDSSLFKLDSISLPYRYFRWNNSVPDTLTIQLYDQSKIRARTTTWASGASYASVNYDYKSNKGTSPTKEIIYILENKDTALWGGTKRLNFEANLPFDTGQLAVTFSFSPGVPANLGDTIDVYMDSLPKKRTNAFIVYEFRDEAPYVESKEYNNGLSATSSVRYNTNTNGWNGSYQPGTSWASSRGIYHFDVDFLISSIEPKAPPKPNSTLKLTSKLEHGFFPNPARNELFVFCEGHNPSVRITNLLGEVVINNPIESEVHSAINLSELKSGVYFLTFNSNGENLKSEKLIVY